MLRCSVILNRAVDFVLIGAISTAGQIVLKPDLDDEALTGLRSRQVA
ncbi:MAG: hypothetical protein HC916_02025 [Coleofasciculaceae cyanobacterium SM2_1_6]|nr:hypothetical protein [Coleofasciculaceae cyanobacterium SM2_1_6]